jgi:DNA-binding NarL/FixJ family response regulator
VIERIKVVGRCADGYDMNPERVDSILTRYREHARRFDAIAALRPSSSSGVFLSYPDVAERAPSHRELEVLQLVARGLVNREIGEELFVTEETVKSHVRSILARLPAKSRAHAVAIGFQRGFIS